MINPTRAPRVPALCTSRQGRICTPADCPGCFNPHCWVVDHLACRSGCDVASRKPHTDPPPRRRWWHRLTWRQP